MTNHKQYDIIDTEREGYEMKYLVTVMNEQSQTIFQQEFTSWYYSNILEDTKEWLEQINNDHANEIGFYEIVSIVRIGMV